MLKIEARGLISALRWMFKTCLMPNPKLGAGTTFGKSDRSEIPNARNITIASYFFLPFFMSSSQKTAIIYLRSASSNSIQAQRSLCREFARRNNFKVQGEFYDDANSKYMGKINALEFANTYRVNALIVQDADRLTRNVFDYFTILSDLRERGVSVLLAARDSENATDGKFLDTILASVEAFEDRLFSRKQSRY